ncbi:hypothetical protein F4776DRAFT_634204 [Hypoxylon sp. NC0597]|nr:hypothetical protein F4776DRAFT_634204 [Hypoxylon sp. NC0597]
MLDCKVFIVSAILYLASCTITKYETGAITSLRLASWKLCVFHCGGFTSRKPTITRLLLPVSNRRPYAIREVCKPNMQPDSQALGS